MRGRRRPAVKKELGSRTAGALARALGGPEMPHSPHHVRAEKSRTVLRVPAVWRPPGGGVAPSLYLSLGSCCCTQCRSISFHHDSLALNQGHGLMKQELPLPGGCSICDTDWLVWDGEGGNTGL